MIPPGAVMDPTRDFGSGGGWRDFMPARIHAHRVLRAYFDAVTLPGARRMVYDVCCLGKALDAGTDGHFRAAPAKTTLFKQTLDEIVPVHERLRQR